MTSNGISNTLPVLIIGAGISGIALARLLHVRSVPFKLFDVKLPHDSQGYGITLASWSFDPLLEAIGSTSEKFRVAVATDCRIGGTGVVGPVFKDGYTGQPLNPPKAQTREFFRANRGRLREWMAEGLPQHDVFWGWMLEGIEIQKTEEYGVSVKAIFAGQAEPVVGRMIVACDGTNSRVREVMLPEAKLESFPMVFYHGERDLSREDFNTEVAQHMDGKNMLASGVDRGILWSVIADISDKSVKLNWGYSRKTPDSADLSNGEIANLAEMILNDIQELGPLAAPWDTMYDRERVTRDIKHFWRMKTLSVPKSEFEKLIPDHIVLIGDAAHSLPVFGGEGGNQSIFDAVQLAEILGGAATNGQSLETSVQQFYDLAYGRWKEVVDGTEARVAAMHRPIDRWRSLEQFDIWKRNN